MTGNTLKKIKTLGLTLNGRLSTLPGELELTGLESIKPFLSNKGASINKIVVKFWILSFLKRNITEYHRIFKLRTSLLQYRWPWFKCVLKYRNHPRILPIGESRNKKPMVALLFFKSKFRRHPGEIKKLEACKHVKILIFRQKLSKTMWIMILLKWLITQRP